MVDELLLRMDFLAGSLSLERDESLKDNERLGRSAPPEDELSSEPAEDVDDAAESWSSPLPSSAMP